MTPGRFRAVMNAGSMSALESGMRAHIHQGSND
jgi:hypothetical protein